MMELGHDVGSDCWKEGEEEIALYRGKVGRSTCCSDKNLERACADVCAWGFGSEVVSAGAGVGYCGILWWNGRVWGGATGKGRKTIFSSKCII